MATPQTFTQETFCGASICNFSATVGWGSQPSVFEVNLVEDLKHGDNFVAPIIGSAAYFDYKGWQFGGLVQRWSKKYGEEGNPLYAVELQDPRELLDGVKLILNDYYGDTSTWTKDGITYNFPNLYNVFGYWESYGNNFGGSLVNDTGMPWKMVRDGFYNLQLTNPIRFRGSVYICTAFMGMDLLPDYFRIPGDSISVMDFIREVCEAVGYDYFITLWNGYILVNLINRKSVIVTGAIGKFIDSTEGSRAKNVNYELANVVTNKVLIGGKQHILYFQPQAGTGNNDDTDDPNRYYDDVILPYWGYDCFGYLVYGNGEFSNPSGDGSEYTFRIDGRPMYIQTGIPALIDYSTDLAEMRAAADSEESWQAFLWWHKDDSNSIHYRKATLFGLTDGINLSIKTILNKVKDKGLDANGVPKDAEAIALQAKWGGKPQKLSTLEDKVREKKISRIYEYIRTFATEYYGRKFMVAVPFVMVAKKEADSSDDIISFSYEPTESAYVAKEYWGQTTLMGYTPYDLEKFTTQENKINCFVGFSKMSDFEINEAPVFQCKYVLDHLNTEDYTLDQYPNQSVGKMRENLFVRAQIDTSEGQFAFYQKGTFTSAPKVVVVLPAPIADNDNDDFEYNTVMISEFKKYLLDEPADTTVDSERVKKYLQKFGMQAGAEYMWYGKEYMFHIPDLAALPFQHNMYRYGPWWATGNVYLPGKTEYDVDDTLVPWNYGGYSQLDLTGLSKVQDALITQQVHEGGTIEFPGIPGVQLGSALMEAGPIVTDVSVNIAEDGVTTTYRMNTWSYQFGKLGKYNIDRLATLSKSAVKQRKDIRKLYDKKLGPVPISAGSSREMRAKRSNEARSASGFITGEVVVGGEGANERVKTNIATTAEYKLLAQVSDLNYVNKAGISLDGIFVPYTTNPSVTYTSHLPHFETPTAGAESPTVNDLNPFGSNGIALVFPEQQTVPTDMTQLQSSFLKGIGLRSPIVVGGWGYDINGKPVPVSDDPDTFLADYKNRADQWKVGPLDIRWDDDRKVWRGLGGGTANIKILELTQGLVPSGNSMAIEWGVRHDWEEGDGTTPFWKTANDPIRVYDFLLALGRQQFKGDKIVAGEITLAKLADPDVEESTDSSVNLWVVLNGQCNC